MLRNLNDLLGRDNDRPVANPVADRLHGVWNRGLQDPAWTPTGGLLAAGPWANRGFSSVQGVLVMTAGISVSGTAGGALTFTSSRGGPGSSATTQLPGASR